MKKLILSYLLAAMTVLSFSVSAQSDRNVAEYNLNSQGTGLINYINGMPYDPVSYFPEGGSKVLKGTAEFALTYKQVEYFFANENNMKTFLTDPSKFEPTYGGWCARAMVVGQKVRINAEIYTVKSRRIYFFVNKRAKRFFDRNVDKNAGLADAQWNKISGEAARL